MKTTTALFAFLCFSFLCKAQHHFGVKAAGNLSKVCHPVKDNYSYLSPDLPKVQIKPAGAVGFYYNYAIGKQAFLGMETVVNRVEGGVIANFESGDVWDLDDHLTYLSGVISYSRVVKERYKVELGLQLSYLLYGTSTSFSGGNSPYFEYSEYDAKESFIQWDTGPRLGIHYFATKRVSIEANVYYGITALESSGTKFYAWESYTTNIQQLSLGFRYGIAGKEKEEKPSTEPIL